jgi:hypothetical protein
VLAGDTQVSQALDAAGPQGVFGTVPGDLTQDQLDQVIGVNPPGSQGSQLVGPEDFFGDPESAPPGMFNPNAPSGWDGINNPLWAPGQEAPEGVPGQPDVPGLSPFGPGQAPGLGPGQRADLTPGVSPPGQSPAEQLGGPNIPGSQDVPGVTTPGFEQQGPPGPAPSGGFDIGSLFGISPANAANTFGPGEQIMGIDVQPGGQQPSLQVPGSTTPSTLRAIADENGNLPSPLVGPADFTSPSFNPNAAPAAATPPGLIGGGFDMLDPALTPLSSTNPVATSPPGLGPVATVEDPNATQLTVVPGNTVSNNVIPGAQGAPPSAFIGDQSQFNAIDAQAPPAPSPSPGFTPVGGPSPGPAAGPGAQPSSPSQPGAAPVDLGTPTTQDVSAALANAPSGGYGSSDGGGGDGAGNAGASLAQSITQPIPPADGTPPDGTPPFGGFGVPPIEDINFGNINPEEGLFGPQQQAGGFVPPEQVTTLLGAGDGNSPQTPNDLLIINGRPQLPSPGGVDQGVMAGIPADDVNNALSNAGSV